MKFSKTIKKDIINCILEKISQGTASLSKSVSESFKVNPSTVHSYLNELVDKGVIKRIKRGQYELVSQEFSYKLLRDEGTLEDESYAFDTCLRKHVSELDKNIYEIWSYAFSEMINNIIDHSAAGEADITIKQDYMSTSVMIYDNGVGIFRKIRDYFGLPSVDEAICELFKGKLTTDKENHSGEGIFFTSKLMDDFFITSGGKIFTTNKYDDSSIIDSAMENQNGTFVFMKLSNYSKKTAGEVFDEYSDMDRGFEKTIIPMKNIFDGSPVSRSQAKRVCNRLDKFREVIVDFDEIPWMGQGFAHQLFVVFGNSHPEIKLTPVNMSEDVTKMYNHVRS